MADGQAIAPAGRGGKEIIAGEFGLSRAGFPCPLGGVTNLRRSTPERTLLAFAAVLALAVIVSVRNRLGRASLEWSELPTALGDGALVAMESVREVRFGVPERPFIRRGGGPVERPNPRMIFIGWSAAGEWRVYADREAPVAGKYIYLKTAEDRFLEFETP